MQARQGAAINERRYNDESWRLRMVNVLTFARAVTLLLALQLPVTLLFAQLQTAQIDLSPADPADNDVITFKLSGTWSNGCIPQSPVVSVSAGTVRIDTTNPGVACTQALTPWMLSGTIGKLSPGRYDVIVRFSGPNLSTPLELGRRSLTVVAAAPAPCLLVCNRPSTEKLSSAQITAVKPAREFKMPMTINPNRQTAVALINPSSSDPVTVKVSILDSAGQSAQLAVSNSFEITLRPLERVSKYFWQMASEQSPLGIAPNPPGFFQGSLVFSSDLPFVVSGLHIMYPEGKFVPVPAVSTR